MTDGAKINQAELQEMFGDTIPMEAVQLLWSAPGDWTIARMRDELRALGAAHKAKTPSLQKLIAEALIAHCHKTWDIRFDCAAATGYADAILPVIATFLRERSNRLQARAIDVERTIAEMME